MVAAQSPESAAYREGAGITRPATRRVLASRHHPVTPRKSPVAARDASALAGSSVKPSTRPSIPGSAPSESALVSAP